MSSNNKSRMEYLEDLWWSSALLRSVVHGVVLGIPLMILCGWYEQRRYQEDQRIWSAAETTEGMVVSILESTKEIKKVGDYTGPPVTLETRYTVHYSYRDATGEQYFGSIEFGTRPFMLPFDLYTVQYLPSNPKESRFGGGHRGKAGPDHPLRAKGN